MKDEITCKSEIKTLIKQIIHKKLWTFKKELNKMKRSIQERTTRMAGSGQRSYCKTVKDKKEESIIIVKPRKKQEGETTKKLVKEKIDIKNLAAGISKLRKTSKGTLSLNVRVREKWKS